MGRLGKQVCFLRPIFVDIMYRPLLETCLSGLRPFATSHCTIRAPNRVANHPDVVLQVAGYESRAWLMSRSICPSRANRFSVGIPVKVNIDSGGKPNGIPERR